MSSQINFHTIVLPVRPQPDTIVAIFILKQFGQEKFPEIATAGYKFWPSIPEGQSPEILLSQGVILIDVGGGMFDHHNKETRTTASELVCQFLELTDHPGLQKLLEYARRDDFFGKGTVSDDALDRAFGLSGLIAALNKGNSKNPEKVIEIVLPLIAAHFEEENRRLEEFPKEVETQKNNNKFIEFLVKQRDKKLKIAMIESDNIGLPGYLRSQIGGRHDVVVQKNSSGHVNILTRPTKRIDLRSLAALIRLKESENTVSSSLKNTTNLMSPGKIEEAKNWYFDTATNSILNGGSNPSSETPPTVITWSELKKIVELGLSEELINPY